MQHPIAGRQLSQINAHPADARRVTDSLPSSDPTAIAYRVGRVNDDPLPRLHAGNPRVAPVSVDQLQPLLSRDAAVVDECRPPLAISEYRADRQQQRVVLDTRDDLDI
ncbi:MAG TPA: hypothetical protein VM491_06310, partial [Burkholderiaceae bacterium]|nr:hypothetical protein [Burkholderiaceae bacterium]